MASNAGATVDRSLTWVGDMATAIADNQFPGNTNPFTYAQQSQNFTYTSTRRLASAKGYYGTLGWTYDANGNRATETTNGVTSTYAYPATSDRLTSVTPAGGTARSFAYDAGDRPLPSVHRQPSRPAHGPGAGVPSRIAAEKATLSSPSRYLSSTRPSRRSSSSDRRLSSRPSE
jgi:hypothetical protein